MTSLQVRKQPGVESSSRLRAFTLIELLVAISIIALMVSLLLPAMSAARQTGTAAQCLGNLRTLGQGLVMYTTDHADQLVPGRLPKIDNDNWRTLVLGGFKYRPTFLAMMGTNVGIQAFADPMPSATMLDMFGEKGDRQNYSSRVYVCPATPEWTDERNGSYGYNYSFLGNSRLKTTSDITSFKNWPVSATRIKDPSRTVAVADSMGTAATVGADHRMIYANNANEPERFGNEGFNLDPPKIAPANGESAGYPTERTAADPRHLKKSSVMFVDTHVESMTPSQLGYQLGPHGEYLFDGNNSLWSGTGRDEAWVQTD